MAAAKQKHVRIICPHCGKNVSLSPPRTPLGFVKPIPCPSCHIPITPAHVRAQTEPAPEAEAEEESTAEPTTDDSTTESEPEKDAEPAD